MDDYIGVVLFEITDISDVCADRAYWWQVTLWLSLDPGQEVLRVLDRLSQQLAVRQGHVVPQRLDRTGRTAIAELERGTDRKHDGLATGGCELTQVQLHLRRARCRRRLAHRPRSLPQHPRLVLLRQPDQARLGIPQFVLPPVGQLGPGRLLVL